MNKTILVGAFIFILVGIGVVVYTGIALVPASLPVTVTPLPGSTETPELIPEVKPAPTPTPSSGITMVQVARHSSASDCWLVVSGKVYDVTTFISQHPGGEQAITRECGKDATNVFDNVDAHGRLSATQELASLFIGNVKK